MVATADTDQTASFSLNRFHNLRIVLFTQATEPHCGVGKTACNAGLATLLMKLLNSCSPAQMTDMAAADARFISPCMAFMMLPIIPLIIPVTAFDTALTALLNALLIPLIASEIPPSSESLVFCAASIVAPLTPAPAVRMDWPAPEIDVKPGPMVD